MFFYTESKQKQQQQNETCTSIREIVQCVNSMCQYHMLTISHLFHIFLANTLNIGYLKPIFCCSFELYCCCCSLIQNCSHQLFISYLQLTNNKLKKKKKTPTDSFPLLHHQHETSKKGVRVLFSMHLIYRKIKRS